MRTIALPIFYILLIITGCTLTAVAQKGSIKGVVIDSTLNKTISAATITVLKRQDSSMVSFTMTNSKGIYEIGSLSNGDYRLLVSHINYHNQSIPFSISDALKSITLPSIYLRDLSQMLEGVIVTAEAPPVTLKGDTIQYNAGSFKTPPNATVEELLKKLPGLEVDKDGNIKAQGEKIKKVLVDGKPFFGNDPKIATRNLPSDAIDKVQVFKKSSDQSQLTGFDDGNSERTIDLKLKEGKKKGGFGKGLAGIGSKDRWEGQLNINSFKGARQLAVIANANNINNDGFSFNNMLAGAGTPIQISGAPSMGGGAEGLRTVWGTGFNYNNRIGQKTDLTSNYFFNNYHPKEIRSIERQYFLKDSSYYYQQNSNNDNKNLTHQLGLSADSQIDSFQSVKVSPSFSYQNTHNYNDNTYQTLTGARELANSGNRSNETLRHGFDFNNELLFRKKFRKKGRTLSFLLNTGIKESDGQDHLQSITNFYQPGNSFADTIRQHTNNADAQKRYEAKIAYTEPLSRTSLLEFSVTKSNSKSEATKTTYDYNEHTRSFDLLNDSLSNIYSNKYGFGKAGIQYRFQQRKYNFTIGLAGQKAALQGNITAGTKDSTIVKTFYNFLPNARLEYKFTSFKTLSVNYYAATNQPSLSQLQPVPNLSDPLYIQYGNPYLKQEYNHSVVLNYTAVDMYRNKSLFIFFNSQLTQNKIVNYNQVDSLGRQYTQPVNVSGGYNLMGSMNWSFGLPSLDAQVTVGGNLALDHSKQFINTVANDVTNLSIAPTLRLSWPVSDKLELITNMQLQCNRTSYSLQSTYNTSYLTQSYGGELSWQLPARLYFRTDFTYTINSQLASGFNAKVPFWNTSIRKQILSSNRGEIKLTAYDLLNQNIGVKRSNDQNYIEDSRVTNLKRYFMLTFTYGLNRIGR